MDQKNSALSDWTPEQIEAGRRWVEAWKVAGPMLEQLKRQELRTMDRHQAIQQLFGISGEKRPRPETGIGNLHRILRRATRG